MKSILALDYGRRRVGIACSDALGLTAQPYGVLDGRNRDLLISEIDKLISEKQIQKIIIGYPLNLKGQTGSATNRVERFAERLTSATKIPVELWDERLTSVQAQKVIHQMGKKPSQHKAKIDTLSAVLILQNYIDHHQMRQNRDEKECV